MTRYQAFAVLGVLGSLLSSLIMVGCSGDDTIIQESSTTCRACPFTVSASIAPTQIER